MYNSNYFSSQSSRHNYCEESSAEITTRNAKKIKDAIRNNSRSSKIENSNMKANYESIDNSIRLSIDNNVHDNLNCTVRSGSSSKHRFVYTPSDRSRRMSESSRKKPKQQRLSI